VVIVAARDFTAERKAIVHRVLHADADQAHRIPAAALGESERVQGLAGERLVTQRADAAHDVRTPAGTDVAEEPAAGNGELNALPLMTFADRAVVVVRVVDAVFEIDGEVRVVPNADSDAEEGGSLRIAFAVRNDCTDARCDVPSPKVLGLCDAHAAAAQGEGD